MLMVKIIFLLFNNRFSDPFSTLIRDSKQYVDERFINLIQLFGQFSRESDVESTFLVRTSIDEGVDYANHSFFI